MRRLYYFWEKAAAKKVAGVSAKWPKIVSKWRMTDGVIAPALRGWYLTLGFIESPKRQRPVGGVSTPQTKGLQVGIHIRVQ